MATTLNYDDEVEIIHAPKVIHEIVGRKGKVKGFDGKYYKVSVRICNGLEILNFKASELRFIKHLHIRSGLTPQKIKEIKELIGENYSFDEIAAMYHVSVTHIYAINNGEIKQWR